MLPLIPYPHQVRENAGAFTLHDEAALNFTGSVPSALADLLIRQIAGSTGITLKPTNETAAIILSISDRTRIHRGNEAYELTVTPGEIRLAAADEAGLCHGVTTLLQLVEQTGEGVSVPAVEIEDCPVYPWRGCHLDVARHFFDVGFVKKFIDLLALHKLNRFHWHLTDDQGWRIESKRYSKLTEIGAFRRNDDGSTYGGFYTQLDIRDLIAYAAARGITVVPEIDLPGHTLALLAAHPELSCTGGPFEVAASWGVFEDVLCPGKEATYSFLADLLDELIGLFPGEYFHIGGDECPSVRFATCPDCQRRIRNEHLHGVEDLQPYFTNRIAEIVAAHGKRLIGWDEIAERSAPGGAIIMAWRSAERGIAAAKKGHDVIMSPTSHCYFDYYQAKEGEPKAIGGFLPLDKVYEFDPAAGFPEASVDRVLGGQANVWTEYMPTPEHVEYMTLPRLCALAERLWSGPEAADYARFLARVGPHLDRLGRLGYRYRAVDNQSAG